MSPGSCVMEGTNNLAAYLDPVVSTCSTGSTLDWFMVSGGLAINAGTRVDKDTHIFSHYPVHLEVGGTLSEDMGPIIRRPNTFKGFTKKEAKKKSIPEGSFETKAVRIDDNWMR